MNSNRQGFGLENTRVVVGTSTIIGATAVTGQIAVHIRKAAGGSLLVGGPDMTYDNGLRVTSLDSQIFELKTAGNVYFRAVGSTATVDVLHLTTIQE